MTNSKIQKVRTSLTIDSDLLEWVRQFSEVNKLSVSAVLQQAAEAFRNNSDFVVVERVAVTADGPDSSLVLVNGFEETV